MLIYDENFKQIVLEEFKLCPYVKTISKKFGICKETLKNWIRREKINVEELRELHNIELNDFKSKINPIEVAQKEKYDVVVVVDEVRKTSANEIMFEINGYKIKISKENIREFVRSLAND